MTHRDVTRSGASGGGGDAAGAAKPKRRYTMSPKALAQRQKANLRHGGRSVGVSAGGAGLNAADLAHFEPLREALERAIRVGDRSALEPYITGSMAPLVALHALEASRLYGEGLVLVEKVKTGDVDAQNRPIWAERKRTNPRARMVFELARLLGIDAREQGTTPRSATRAEGPQETLERHWEWMEEVKRRTSGSSGAESDASEGENDRE